MPNETNVEGINRHQKPPEVFLTPAASHAPHQ